VGRSDGDGLIVWDVRGGVGSRSLGLNGSNFDV
jgi:hypothetical protein